MISFMVLGAGRSATTWLANLLSTDTTLCLHDPLTEYRVDQLDKIMVPGKRIGISDTNAAFAYPEWVHPHSAKKVILYRDIEEVNRSLRALGLGTLDPAQQMRALYAVPGAVMYQWNAVFQGPHAQKICEHLGVPFCAWRFAELKKMNIQPQFNRLPVDPEATKELIRRVAEAMLRK